MPTLIGDNIMQKIKMNKKNIFKIIYGILIIINTVVLFFFILFAKDNAYNAIIIDQNYLLQNKKINAINMIKFEESLENIKQKKEEINIPTIKNIFN